MKRFLKSAIIVVFILFINIFFWTHMEIEDSTSLSAELEIQSEDAITVQIFESVNGEFDESNSQSFSYVGPTSDIIKFSINDNVKYVRFDLGEKESKILIKRIEINSKGVEANFLKAQNDLYSYSNMINMQMEGDFLVVESIGDDPYLVYSIEPLRLHENVQEYLRSERQLKRIVLCISFTLICLISWIFRKKISLLWKEIFYDRRLIFDLAKNDFKTKYAGSYLGIIWAFIQPITTIMVYWFVFQVGFRSGEAEGVPFVLWLTVGLVPWFFFNESLNGATSSLLDYSYLVKKVVFNVGIIPPVRVLSALFVHLFFIGFMLILFLLNGIFPNITWIQLIYYSSCLILLVLGISYATSALVIFFRDLGQIIIVILQVGMWATPIMWNIKIMPERLHWIIKLNPLCYIVQGYRDAVIYHKWFWNNPYQTVYFWIVTLFFLYIGSRVFYKLKDHFADVI